MADGEIQGSSRRESVFVKKKLTHTQLKICTLWLSSLYFVLEVTLSCGDRKRFGFAFARPALHVLI